MEFVNVLALVMLTLVGYSAGVVLARRNARLAPGLLDISLVLVLWIGAIATRVELGKWKAIGVWMAAALIAGAFARIASVREDARPDYKRVTPQATGRFAWWKRFAMQLGNYQGRMLMAFFYAFIITPFGVLTRASSDRLQLRRPRTPSAWRDRTVTPDSIDAARRQF